MSPNSGNAGYHGIGDGFASRPLFEASATWRIRVHSGAARSISRATDIRPGKAGYNVPDERSLAGWRVLVASCGGKGDSRFFVWLVRRVALASA